MPAGYTFPVLKLDTSQGGASTLQGCCCAELGRTDLTGVRRSKPWPLLSPPATAAKLGIVIPPSHKVKRAKSNSDLRPSTALLLAQRRCYHVLVGCAQGRICLPFTPRRCVGKKAHLPKPHQRLSRARC